MKLPAYFTGFASKSDGSASLRFTTQELQPSDFAILKELHNAFGYLLFQENPIQPEDVPKEQAEDKNKTPSKRLRAALYVFWEQKGKPMGNFEAFYQHHMNEIIERVKSKLD